ncbi:MULTISPECIES: ATP-binding cassette domain-containing protein [unclassified Variovorax]|jgi:ABC-2 type transport system ATP-binding protein|uniref:ATP-binding cassette domain-containing protein n=1 Tax=unclassified Variovorax TaxID=663243 RepID=UPI000F7E237D|nr:MULTISPECIES: ATP-binding cassette domain-containing protein [unclassified Variovorax]RSZ34412.1 ABC transporter ATP-binding protein [Variovorax sp. 553]RSZ34909.1 ABC transporter ATP-binding protein [Variovorax sp. 679]
MTATGPAVAGRSLHKRFVPKPPAATVHALDDVSLEIPAGTLTALVGPDGAGKTTLLRLMAGLMRADEGELRVLGIDVSADPQAVQDRISYMPQRFGLYDDLSVQENLDLYADLHGVPRDKRRERYARLMEMTDLGRFTDRPAGKLSGGMKQKLGLACTLVRSPDLLLLDEPTVGVDPLSRRELWEIVQQLVDEEQLSVIVSTAYLDEAERCSHVFVLHGGKLLAQGAPGELRDRADGLCFIATPPGNEPPRLLQARLLDAWQDIVDAVPQGGEVRFIRRDASDAVRLDALLEGARTEPVAPRLEDGFMTLLRAQPSNDGNASPAAAIAPQQSPGQSGEVVIEVKNLVRRFGDFVAVASTSFSVRRGEIFGLLGPNGAGKTTTFRMLCGLLPASGGQLRVAGVDLRHARAQARQRIGYVSQKFALYGNLTVRENLSFFGGAYGLRGAKLRERMDTVLRQFDLAHSLDSPSGQLPGGYKQRLAMATGLLHEPEILFLDEPTSGADPLARREFWRRITALAEGGTTVVITTHFMEEAEYCDRIVIQDAGKVLAIGTPQEVRAQALGDDREKRIDMEQAFIGIVEKARQADTKQVAA